MTVNESAQAYRHEPRWPVVLTIAVVIGLLALLPGRVKLLPNWFPYVIGIVGMAPILAVELARSKSRWFRIERIVTLMFAVFIIIGNLTNLITLFLRMVNQSTQLGGLQLFASSIAVWVTNVLAFSLLYWQVDSCGPEARLNNEGQKADWLFPQMGESSESVPAGWEPAFIDYLYLGYSTATAFSATDALPLTARAKLLMMLESTISLLTLVVVAARAINILG